MAVSPMAPLVQMKMQKGGFDASAAIGLYVALILSAILFVPATVALLSALYPAEASISVAAVAKLVAITTLIPVAVGLAIGSWLPEFARKAAPVVLIIGFIVVGLLAVLVLYKQGGAILGLFGDGSMLAIIVTVASGLAAGHWLGRPDPASSSALAMAAGDPPSRHRRTDRPCEFQRSSHHAGRGPVPVDRRADDRRLFALAQSTDAGRSRRVFPRHSCGSDRDILTSGFPPMIERTVRPLSFSNQWCRRNGGSDDQENWHRFDGGHLHALTPPAASAAELAVDGGRNRRGHGRTDATCPPIARSE